MIPTQPQYHIVKLMSYICSLRIETHYLNASAPPPLTLHILAVTLFRVFFSIPPVFRVIDFSFRLFSLSRDVVIKLMKP